MRFKKGSKVEVWDTRDAPSGCWWPAVIISGNGHYYSVTCDLYALDGAGAVANIERVPRRSIRPCPPSGLLCPDAWVAGDIVEAYEDGSWRLAEILSVAGRNHFLVRLLGSDYAFEVHCSNIRLRLQWKDDKWLAIGKDFALGHDVHSENRFPEGSGRVIGRRGTGLERNHLGPRKERMKKASKEAKLRVAKRVKAFDEDGASKSMVAGNSFWLPEKVDAISYPKDLLGEKYMLTSHNKRTGYSEMVPDSRDPYVEPGYLRMRDLGSRRADIYSSCSSSGSNNPDMLYLDGQCLELNECSDDAQSFCRPDTTEYIQPKEHLDVDAEVHRIELHAYRSTLEALYVSGPISWEQEALITNLRLSLNISNDEHLVEIRNLASHNSKTCS